MQLAQSAIGFSTHLRVSALNASPATSREMSGEEY